MDVSLEFKGKKITLMGLGLLGRGVGDAEFLAECGAELIITDLKTAEQLEESLERLSFYPNITYVLGEHRFEDFEGRDMILKAAGVPFDSPYIAHARESGVPIHMSGALFARLSGIPIIAVTGSRGKSTTTGLIHHTLTRSTEGGSVHLGGNVRGVSNLQLLKKVQEGDIAVMELDSWQLQGFGEAAMSPHIAVFTSFLPDHMDYYRGDMDAYFDDKAHIFSHQEAGDVFITTPDVFAHVEKYVARTKHVLVEEVVLTDKDDVPIDWVLPIPGEHNRTNIALAIEALRATTLSEESIREGIETFEALSGRLEYLGEVHGVKVYNDNNATSPAATRAGLEAVSAEQNVILIMGGSDKRLDMKPLLEIIPTYAKDVILLPGTGSDSIESALPNAHKCHSLSEAVEEAFARAEAGDTILFSPAFASFGLFKNEYDRNDQFVALIQDKMNS
ncbi:UDP-N-acetylmuramoyl-L-alanine--D-glutamate ligase [Patescibacteria group bacterium]|nr:UDP-N-acetylmuramoyl-L-alanine--D-glutamate ligase [Patescibacteria group bacterium]